MPAEDFHAAWTSADAYERWCGRWSRPIAQQFVPWLSVPEGASWLDVGCGTGVLTEAILRRSSPRRILGVDRSAPYIAEATRELGGKGIRFRVRDLQRGLAERQAFDAVVAGLVLNFVSDPEAAVRDMATACRPGGTVAVYVWDYLDGMEIIRLFWEQAFRSDRSITRLPEVRRYPLCRPAPLRANFTRAELEGIEVRPLDAPARFRDFDDYWQPFLGGQGTAPTYLATLRDEQRNQLRERLRRSLPTAADGSISLHVRAWAVRGTVRA